jgi:hypothetical protein
MNISWQLIAEGNKFNILEVLENNKSPFREFYESLPSEGKNKLTKDIETLADVGPMRNEEKFRHEEDGIYAIKKSKGINKFRVYCFFDRGNLIILTNGCIKQRRKANPGDLAKAKRLRDLYLEKRSKDEGTRLV